MKRKPVTYSLIKFYREIAGELLGHKIEAAKLRNNLKHVGAVIHLYEPRFDLRTIAPHRKHSRNQWFSRGETLQRGLSALRVAGKPLTSRQIAIAILEGRKVPGMSEALIAKTARSIHVALTYRLGKSVAAHTETMPTRWSLLS